MKRTYIYIFTVLALMATASCTKNFDKINTNPNKLQYGEAPATSMFEPLLYGIGINNQYQAWFFANELVQVHAFTGGQTTQVHQYQVTDGQWQSQWDNFARYGFDAHHMINQAIAQGDKYMEALGLIIKVFEHSQLSALFGDVPYKEAYQQTANTAPVFDSQEELLDEYVADLDSAATILKRHPDVLKPGIDGMYQNNYTRWIKFANSLKMRLLCRMSGIDDSYWAAIQAMVDAPEQYPVFSENADNAAVPFKDVDPYRSYWKQDNTTESNFVNHRFTQTMIDMMAEFNASGNATFEDPRLQIYAVQKGGVWKGSRGGVPSADFKQYDTGSAVPNFSILTNSGVPAFLMDYSEVLFILAEGVQKGKLTVPGQTAKSLYESAVRASIDKWATYGLLASKPIYVRSADVTQLLASSFGSYDKAAAQNETSVFSSVEELIACQKFISLYYCGYEVFNEWRRTEYPAFEIADGTSSNGYEVPTRFGYPNYTVASNSAHVNAALQRMGGPGAVNNMHLKLDWSFAKLNGGHRRPHPLQQ